MFGGGFSPYSSPPCGPSMMCPYDVPVPQPYPTPVPVPQPYLQNMVQHVDVPVQHTIQPVIVQTPVPVPVPQPVPYPVDRPCMVPVPQPVPYPVDRPCAVPVPVPVQQPPMVVHQPCIVREQVPVPVPVPYPVAVPTPMPQQQEYQAAQPYRQVEYIYEEPIRIKRRRRHRRRCRSYGSAPAPLPPIIIPFHVPASAAQQQPQYQVTEYVQDIYPPAQVYTEQVPVGYVAKNSLMQQPNQIQSQQTTLNYQPGIILPPAPYNPSSGQLQQQPQLVQQLSSGELIQRPLSVGGGGGVQTVILQQPGVSPANSVGVIRAPTFTRQFITHM